LNINEEEKIKENKIEGSENKEKVEKEDKTEKTNKPKIIPSYKKVGDTDISNKDIGNKDKTNNSKKSKKNKEKKEKNKKTRREKIRLISIIIIAIFIVSAITGIYIFVNSKKYSVYEKYEENMKIYGFDKVYDNGSAKTSDSVTKSEVVKMVIAVTYNTDDISGFAKEVTDEYSNAIWVEYAISKEIINPDEITKENADEKATYADVIRYFANAKTKLLGKTLDTETLPSIKDYEKYKPDEKLAISDAFQNKLITENVKKLDGYKKLYKGKLNEIVKNYVEKYNTIAPMGEKINISADKTPSNASDYPYTLASIDKSIYEKAFIKKEGKEENFKTPREIYVDKKNVYGQIVEISEGYYNAILNIDYNTITEEEFSEKISQYTINPASPSEIKEYVAYVKENKIRIEGVAKNQAPILYFDGEHYRARLKLEFKILYSDTKNNLLYRDFDYKDFTPSYNAVYEKDEYLVYADVIFSEAYNSKSLYSIELPVFTTIIDKHESGISFKE
jgi:hypothetical protein